MGTITTDCGPDKAQPCHVHGPEGIGRSAARRKQLLDLASQVVARHYGRMPSGTPLLPGLLPAQGAEPRR